MEPQKKNFKINILGIIRLETGELTAKELAVLIIAMGFVIGIIMLLKTYSLPALAFRGAPQKASTLIQDSKSRAP